MKDFETWYKELTSDEKWLDTMQMIHRYKPIKDVALLVYGIAVSENSGLDDMQEHRKHVHNKLAKTAVKVQNIIQTHQPKVEEPKEEPKNIATNEQRDFWLNQLKEQLSKIQTKPVIKLTNKQIAEEGGWIPKKRAVGFDPGYAPEHFKKLRECQEKTVRDRHPEFTEEEIQAYVDKLNTTKP